MGGFDGFIHEAPLIVIVVVLFLAQMVARELGGWTHIRISGRTDEPAAESSDKGHILSGALGLLALLIAFTFELAVNRYEERRVLVMAEANAIGKAEMRVQLLGSREGVELDRMLRAYADTRLAYGRAGAAEKPHLALVASEERDAMQLKALSALEPVATNPLGPFVGESINLVLDIGVEREAVNAARVPATVLAALIIYAVLTAGVLGYALTGARARHRTATAILFALLTLAILLILDLDRPQGGTIRTDQTPMQRLVAGFAHLPIAEPRSAPRPET